MANNRNGVTSSSLVAPIYHWLDLWNKVMSLNSHWFQNEKPSKLNIHLTTKMDAFFDLSNLAADNFGYFRDVMYLILKVGVTALWSSAPRIGIVLIGWIQHSRDVLYLIFIPEASWFHKCNFQNPRGTSLRFTSYAAQPIQPKSWWIRPLWT